MRIKSLNALQIYDSRGQPTVECVAILDNGVTGSGLVPSGASTGQHEALELRDGDADNHGGRSVHHAIDNIENVIAPSLLGAEVVEQRNIDQIMLELDATGNKSKLGANAILAVSMAVANAAARGMHMPLYEYLGNGSGDLLPLPQIQIFGGGAHSGWRTDVQDFMIVALGATSYAQTLEMTHDVYHAAGEWLKRHSRSVGVADEGGYWPQFDSHDEILEALLTCIEQAGYRPGDDIAIALDVAASELFDGDKYHLRLENQSYGTDEFIALLKHWCSQYPIISLEDPLADEDWTGWQQLYGEMGDRIQIIGDDLFTTDIERIAQGVRESVANAVLIKPNQIGTVSETLEAIRYTQNAGWRPVVSARSGETEDTFICHLAVATNAGQLKVGSFARGERTAKWNELLRIQRCLNNRARFIGRKILP